MARRFTEPRLVLASHNPGKLAELSALLARHGVAITSSRELGLREPAETGLTFADNARRKAHAAAQASALPALADDSGLEAYGLGGAPGVHSARWAGPLLLNPLQTRNRASNSVQPMRITLPELVDKSLAAAWPLFTLQPACTRVYIRSRYAGFSSVE